MIPMKPPKLIALVDDISLRQRVEQAAAELAIEITWQLESENLVKQVAQMHPVAILVHLSGIAESAHVIQVLKASPATRRIPVIAFDYHADEILIRQASTTIYQDVYFLVDDSFVGTLVDIIRPRLNETAADLQTLQDQCSQSMPVLVRRGLEEFNAGQYFECHETLEEAWMAETGPVRDVYRAILQIAVAYYQIERRNYNGAMKMFLRSLQWLDPLPDRCQGIEIARFRADALQTRLVMEALGPERIDELNRVNLKPIIFDE